MPHGNTKFQCNWLESKDRQGYRIGVWCEQDPNDAFKAVCTLCNKQIAISNSGKLHILNNADSIKHKQLQHAVAGQKFLKVKDEFSATSTTSVSSSSASNSSRRSLPTSSTGIPMAKPMLFAQHTQEETEKAEDVVFCFLRWCDKPFQKNVPRSSVITFQFGMK